jgi:hypothetical protein
MATPNPNHVTAVVKALDAICAPMIQGIFAVSNANHDAADASEKLGTSRVDQLLAAAKTAHAKQWPQDAIDTAVKQFVDAKLAGDNGNQLNSLKTFGGQLKNAMSPKARETVPSIVAAVTGAWKTETDAIDAAKKAKKDAPDTPLRDMWSKRDHAISALIKEKAKGNADVKEMMSGAAVVAFANKHNPAKELKRVASRIKGIVEDLAAFNAQYPNADVTDCLAVLRTLTADKLIARKTGEDVAADIAAAQTNASEPVEGASDIGESDMLDLAAKLAPMLVGLVKKAA